MAAFLNNTGIEDSDTTESASGERISKAPLYLQGGITSLCEGGTDTQRDDDDHCLP